MYGTGNGLAKKEDVLRDVRDRYGNLCQFANDNEADAALLALALADHLGHRVADVPATHSRALASLDFTAAPSFGKKVTK
jgi:Holliday junction resolvasome RuvABC endonuclease subunit